MSLRHAVRGFQDYADDVPIQLKLDEFSRRLHTHLDLCASSIELPPELESRLFKQTVNFLRTYGAVQELKGVVQGRDQQTTERLIRTTIEGIGDLQKEVASFKGQGLPLTESLAEAILNVFASIRTNLREANRKHKTNKALVTGYIKPELASQFILQISDLLKQRLAKYQQKQRDEIIIGILEITNLFDDREGGLFDVIQMRRLRAKRSEKKARMKERTHPPTLA